MNSLRISLSQSPGQTEEHIAAFKLEGGIAGNGLRRGFIRSIADEYLSRRQGGHAAYAAGNPPVSKAKLSGMGRNP